MYSKTPLRAGPPAHSDQTRPAQQGRKWHRSIRNAMEPRNWKPADENRLGRKADAIMVYTQSAAAGHILEGLLGETIGRNEKVITDEVIRGLCDADRILTGTAIADAGGHPAAAAIFLERRMVERSNLR